MAILGAIAHLLHGTTLDQWVANEARMARANNLVCVHYALGVEATRIGQFTRAETVAVDARLRRDAMVVQFAPFHTRAKVAYESEWTLAVGHTLGGLDDFLLVASGERVALDRRWASANGLVILRSAHGMVAASPVHGARILASVLNARRGE